VEPGSPVTVSTTMEVDVGVMVAWSAIRPAVELK
jgi:hypothetical protein